MEDVFERRKQGLRSGNFLLKNLKVVVDTQSFSWFELLQKMPCMQSVKALLLFVMEQYRFLLPLHHHRSGVLIPYRNCDKYKKYRKYGKYGKYRKYRKYKSMDDG